MIDNVGNVFFRIFCLFQHIFHLIWFP